jgi:DNA-directed RNA polymerase subunit L
MSNFKITNLNKSSNIDLEFIVEDLDHEYVNSIIRSTLQNIPTYGFMIKQTEIIENSNMLNNEIIDHRISMLPLHNPNGLPLQDYVFELNVINNTNDVMTVTTDDFKIKHKTNGTEIQATEIFPHDEITNDPILLARLNEMKRGEKIHLKTSPIIGIGKNHSLFQCTSQASHKFVVDENRARTAFQKKISDKNLSDEQIKEEEKRFNTLERNYYYHQNEDGKPNKIKLMFEAIGSIPVLNIPVLAANGLIKIIDTLKIELSKPRSEKVQFAKDKNHKNSVIVKMIDEDYTIGTILTHYIYKHYVEEENAVSYVGCVKPHLLENNIIIKIVTSDGEIEPVKALLNQSLDQLKILYNTFIKKYENAVKE